MIQRHEGEAFKELISNVGTARSARGRVVETRNDGGLVSRFPSRSKPARSGSLTIPDSEHVVVDRHHRSRWDSHGHLAIRPQLVLARLEQRAQTRVSEL